MKVVSLLYDPKIEIQRLMDESVDLARVATDIKPMKALISCYEILETTEEINRPWDSHPGFLYGDMGAMLELEVFALSIIPYYAHAVDRSHHYARSVQKLSTFWRRVIDNEYRILR